MKICRSLCFCALALAVALPFSFAQTTQPGGGTAAQGGAGLPDLNTMLAAPQSEMRLVTQRYDADRILLNRLYDVSISTKRISRLKRFDADWQAALKKIDASKLTPAAQTDLQTLNGTIERNLAALDTAAAANAQVAPFVPFSKEIIQLEEARRRMDSMDAEKAAVVLNEASKKLAAIRTAFQGQLADAGKPALPNVKTSAKLVARAADAVDKVQNDLRSWFNFYNEYDPMFTWWMAAPFKEVDKGLTDYASLLRDKVAPTASTDDIPAPAVEVAADTGSFDSVPDLQHLLTYPNNEMRTIIQRYSASRGRGGRGGGGGGAGGGAGRGGRGGAGADGAAAGRGNTDGNETDAAAGRGNRGGDTPDEATAQAPARGGRGQGRGNRGGADNGPPLPQASPTEWLAALKKIEFSKLSRNAQVDYLAMRNRLDVEAKRPTLPRNTTVRKQDDNSIPGNPIGPAALQLDIQSEIIPYTPEELIAIGQKEYEWCEAEMKKAAAEMGLGDDWRAAIERTKEKHAPVGKQPDTIRDIIRLDLDFIQKKQLITVPQVAAESLRMEMMSPQRQLVNPFFTGGTLISVSYPTDTMSQEDKLESMRGNNWGFAYATVHHELIPGHNLQGYMAQRFGSLRGGGAGGTPFWGEGWSCYWEMIFLNNGFAHTPEEKVGFLWWRMMRCARIVFSLKFHLGEFSPNDCVDYLVTSIASERKNAAAEVRRSFGGGYSPIYQAAYLLGAIQLRTLHKDMVESGKMTERQFHDMIIENGPMPIALVRLSVTDMPLTPDMSLDWRFAGEHPGK